MARQGNIVPIGLRCQTQHLGAFVTLTVFSHEDRMFSLEKFLTVWPWAKELMQAMRRLPESVGFSVVKYVGERGQRDHLRIVNLAPVTIHGFTCSVKVGDHGQAQPIHFLYRPPTEDVFGDRVTYKLTIPTEGIYLRPGSVYYLPLSELPEKPKANDAIVVSFTYTSSDGKRRPGKVEHVVRVDAQATKATD
jgi:hypothetical protein